MSEPLEIMNAVGSVFRHNLKILVTTNSSTPAATGLLYLQETLFYYYLTIELAISSSSNVANILRSAMQPAFMNISQTCKVIYKVIFGSDMPRLKPRNVWRVASLEMSQLP